MPRPTRRSLPPRSRATSAKPRSNRCQLPFANSPRALPLPSSSGSRTPRSAKTRPKEVLMGTDLLPFTEVTSAIAAVSVIGIFLLLPLYLSQRRDVSRLREWMEQDPDFPATDIVLSERRLDQAERDLAKAYADR